MEQIDDPLQKLIEALHHTLEFMIENRKLIQFIYTESKYLDKKHLQLVLEMDYNKVIGFWRGLLEELKKAKLHEGNSDFSGSLIAFIQVFLPLRGWTVKDMPVKKSQDSLYNFI